METLHQFRIRSALYAIDSVLVTALYSIDSVFFTALYAINSVLRIALYAIQYIILLFMQCTVLFTASYAIQYDPQPELNAILHHTTIAS